MALIARLVIMPLCVLVALGGSMLLWLPGVRGFGFALLVLGFGALIASALAPVADWLLRPLERGMRRVSSGADDGEASPEWIAVLGAGFSKDRCAIGLARLSPTGLVRLTEGVRLSHLHADVPLLLCSYRGAAGADRIDAMAVAALELGVAAERLRVLEAGDSTRSEVEAIAREIGERRGLLVTSAAHMRRALRIAESAGIDAVPAATDFRLHPEDARFVARWLPSTHELDKSERALHEYFAAMRPRPARHRHRR